MCQDAMSDATHNKGGTYPTKNLEEERESKSFDFCPLGTMEGKKQESFLGDRETGVQYI